ncbi:hypothetical protein BDF22DRAFT_243999 [Syncephalis plumigaleata]|nr:hypothetical protein BDF22DRAFT_243999 [Syncephalis plumigaleata]
MNGTSLWHMAALLVARESTSSIRVVFLFTWMYSTCLPYSHTDIIAIDECPALNLSIDHLQTGSYAYGTVHMERGLAGRLFIRDIEHLDRLLLKCQYAEHLCPLLESLLGPLRPNNFSCSCISSPAINRVTQPLLLIAYRSSTTGLHTLTSNINITLLHILNKD